MEKVKIWRESLNIPDGEIVTPFYKPKTQPYHEKDNIIKTYRGTKIDQKELYQWQNKIGQTVVSKSFFSTSTDIVVARGFCGLNRKIGDGRLRILFVINTHLEYTNDCGTNVVTYSHAPGESE